MDRHIELKGQAPPQFMPAREVLNLVAFGVINPADLTGETTLHTRWPIRLNNPEKHLSLLTVLRMRAAGQSDASDWPEADMTDPYSTQVPGRRSMEELQRAASDILDLQGLSAAEAATELEALLRYRDIQSQKLLGASQLVVQAAAGGHLRAFASARPSFGAGIPQADSIPAVRFTTIGIRVWPNGEITFQDGSGYLGAQFDRSEVMGLWAPRTAAAKQADPIPKKKQGGRDYRNADAPLVQEMKLLMDQGVVDTSWAAALRVADRAAGDGGILSRAKRLKKIYSASFSSERS